MQKGCLRSFQHQTSSFRFFTNGPTLSVDSEVGLVQVRPMHQNTKSTSHTRRVSNNSSAVSLVHVKKAWFGSNLHVLSFFSAWQVEAQIGPSHPAS
jgi:hypothetical protein